MLTKRQKQVLTFIKSYQIKKGYAPSLDDVRKHIKIASVSTAHYHIKSLEKLGLLKKQEHQPRALEIFENEQMVQIPLLGTIAAGQPIEAIQEKETIALPKSRLPRAGEFYALRVQGDSMLDENIDDGDTVIVKKQDDACNGEKVVALIDNYQVTLKKIYKEKNQIRLQPANSTINPIFVKPENLMVQGVVIDVIKNIPVPILETTSKTETQIEPVRKSKLNEWLNTIQCLDCVEGMKYLPDNSIDMMVTSPPYDKVRNYNGFSYDLHATGKQIHRLLKPGGIAIMVIQDQTKDFGKTLTSFKTVVDWCDNIGFKLFETVIYKKHGAEGAWWTKRFRVDHEYIPIFLKGDRPAYFNKEPLKIPSKHGGKTMTGCATRLTNGKTLQSHKVTINPLKCRGTIWDYTTCGDGTRLKHQHPATFPDKLPLDFIQCFCPENGIILDPFVGSGTTALAAIKLDRNYIGFDVSKEYCELAKKRIREEGAINKKLF